MTKARELAQFISQLRYADLPTPVVEKAKEIALNSWGVQLAASTLPWSKDLYRYILNEGGAPQSTVVNYGIKTSAANAALANGSFGHGFELDDSHNQSSVKGGCIAVPTALAVAEQRFNNGREVIVAIVGGFEIMIRVGMMCRDVRPKRGYHATAICGPFGAAAVAGKLHGLDEEQLVHALGYAASLAAGLGETPATGRGHMKRLFGGFAAAGGMRAALLAKEGLTGPETMLDGKRGFCTAYGDPEKTDLLTKDLGNDWEILKVHYKIYAQDGYIQPMTQALEKIRRAHQFNPEDIDEIRVGTSRAAHETVVGAIREPKDLTSAQFSAYFSLAMFLIKGGAMIAEYEDAFHDPRVMELSRRIHLSVDDEIEQEFQRSHPRGAKVMVRLKSGQEFREHIHNLRLMDAKEVDDKFRKLASLVLDTRQTENLLVMARELDDVRDVSKVAQLLVPKPTELSAAMSSGARTSD